MHNPPTAEQIKEADDRIDAAQVARDAYWAKKGAYQAQENEAYEHLFHGCDGPITQFVLMARAVKLARKQGEPPPGDDPIANALFRALSEVAPDDSIDTGS